MLSASRPVVGSPSGSVRRIESRYFSCKFGFEGFSAEAWGANFNEMPNLWMRFWKFSVPLVFLTLISQKVLNALFQNLTIHDPAMCRQSPRTSHCPFCARTTGRLPQSFRILPKYRHTCLSHLTARSRILRGRYSCRSCLRRWFGSRCWQ